jgi:hypothetical protein
MRNMDTMDKILGIYISSLTKQTFVYKNRIMYPKAVVVSPLLLRGFTCPSRCGACCGSFSLDYLPTESAAPLSIERQIRVNEREYTIVSDRQADVLDKWCRNLERETGRCRIYDQRPMACDFELIRFLVSDTKVILTQKLYGRAWAMQRIVGSRGTLCEMLPVNEHHVAEVVRKLRRLETWSQFFQISTRIPEILTWIHSSHNGKALRLLPE